MKQGTLVVPEGFEIGEVTIKENSIIYEVKKKSEKETGKRDDGIKGYVARDESGFIGFFPFVKPNKGKHEWECGYNGEYITLEESSFPSVKWENEEPTPVTLRIEL